MVPSSYTESPQALEENEIVDRDTPPPIANPESTAQGREAGLVRDLGSICVRPQSRIHPFFSQPGGRHVRKKNDTEFQIFQCGQ